MSHLGVHKKISFSPARKIVIEEVPKANSTIKIRKYKHLPQTKPSTPQSNSVLYTPKKDLFRPLLIRELFLVEPSEINKLMQTSKQIRVTNLKKPDFSQSKAFRSYNRLRESPRKMTVLVKVPKERDSRTENFFRLIKSNHLEGVKKLIKLNPNIVNETDGMGMNGLHWAIKRDLFQMAKILIDSKSSIVSTDILGRTAQDLAKSSSDPEMKHLISEALLKHNLTHST